jgi:hypothetical protein
MHCVASSTVHDGAIGNVLAVMNEDSPEVDESEQKDVGHLLQGEEEGEDVVGHTLGPAVKRVESVRGVGTGHDPFVVRLVQGLVDARMVQAAVDPVDKEIGKADEEGELDETVERKRLFSNGIVEFGVSADLKNKEWGCQQSHWGHGTHGLLDFQPNLVLEKFRVVVGCLVPNEDV